MPLGPGWGFNPTGVAVVVGDFNGDGMTDYLINQGTQNFVFLSNGDGTFTGVGPTPLGPGWQFNPKGIAVVIGDFNGDGKTDYLINQGTQNFVFLSNGDGTFTTVGPMQLGPGWQFNPTGIIVATGDFNGDGKTDYLINQGTQNFVFLSNGPTFLVSSITTGLGATTSISYAPLTTNVYTKDTGANAAHYPIVDLQMPLYIVAQADASNGVGGKYSSGYAYVGGKVDLGGRGFLGFRQMVVADLQTNIHQTTTFRQDFPFIGRAASQTKTIPSSSTTQTLYQTSKSYQLVASNGGSSVAVPNVTGAPYQVQLTQSVVSGNDLDGTALPTITTTYQYDAFGNATQEVMSTPDGASKTTTNAYTNDTVNWFLGLLTTATVTSTTP
jgi:hypothetical protein